MPSMLLPLLPGTLPPGCPGAGGFANDQDRLNAYAEITFAVLEAGMAFYNYGDSPPSVENQAYPWLRTTDMRWYYFQSVWKSPVNYDLNERRLYVGSTSALITYDGGSAGTATLTTGPMWEVDTDFAGRSPMGPGDIPTSAPPKTLAVNESYGAGSVDLTQAMLPEVDLTVPMFVGDESSGDTYPVVPHTHDSTNQSFDVLPKPLGSGDPVPTISPVRGCYVIKRTVRQFYTA